mgnify:CR=1 FL=1
MLEGLLRRWSRERLAAGHHESPRDCVRSPRRLRLEDRCRGDASAGELLLGPHAVEHTELTLSLTEKARRKALAKARRLRKEDHLT